MTTQTGPVIPPRPTRSPLEKGTADMPKIPPRPTRRPERSVSPFNPDYAPSPLNEPPNSAGLTRTLSHDAPPRPPSVTIPSLGEEGIEYEDLNVNSGTPDSQRQTPAETRNVASDLKLHAPRPSLPTSSAKAKVQAVTRTDSGQAAAAGFGTIGIPVPDEQSERPSRSIYSTQGSRAASSSASFDRPRSIHDEEHGIPEIGQRVPMLANAGDVQAPSPSPYLEQPGSRSGRSHNRTRSGREASLPPGSYGLHGHGVATNDKFEKAWYEKHPDEYAKEEQGHYGSGVGSPRPDWALSSDDLNKIVRGSAVTGTGLGTSPAVAGTPEEEVGYLASDEYSHRLASPGPESKRDSRPSIESPLRNATAPATEAQSESKESPAVIHIDEPYHHLHHPDGFAPTPDPEEIAHKGDGVEDEEEPILAADEVRPEAAYQHPAVSPTFSRRESMDYEGRSRTPSVNESRSNSRAASRRGSTPALARWNSREEIHPPLEDVEEYEPLFPEDESKENKPLSAADRFKQRPDMTKHRFPSQDIWEDSPNSLQLHATVSTPDIPKEDRFETPEQEAARKTREPGIDSHQVAQRILKSEEGQVPSRPGIAKQRFPSRDIWEDAPESQTLVTTIEPSDEKQVTSPDVPSKPTFPPKPEKRQPPQVDPSTKPTSPTEKRQPPVIPDRPKPQIPTRPANRVSRANGEEAQEASTKSKPAIPDRPTGSKIAALKAGFLSDLNSRLQLGPQAPRKQENKEEAPAEKGPLSDARKGRARGPARRKPAAETASPKLPTIPEIKITETWNVWEVREDGNLVVGSGSKTDTSTTTSAPATSFEPAATSPEPTAESPEPTATDTGAAATSTEPAGWNDTMAPPIARSKSGESVDPPRQPEKDEVLESHDPEMTTMTTVTEAAKTEPAETSPAGSPKSADKPVDAPSTVSETGKVDTVADSSDTADGKRAADAE
ncbi:altered inheritance of mitochondria protein 21 [Aspergillus egyptiacus]|nr:altered inheritance of mitochondria protein 21 [Aspergillus egyptiacus]